MNLPNCYNVGPSNWSQSRNMSGDVSERACDKACGSLNPCLKKGAGPQETTPESLAFRAPASKQRECMRTTILASQSTSDKVACQPV